MYLAVGAAVDVVAVPVEVVDRVPVGWVVPVLDQAASVSVLPVGTVNPMSLVNHVIGSVVPSAVLLW